MTVKIADVSAWKTGFGDKCHWGSKWQNNKLVARKTSEKYFCC
jgi:hypothetical protein